MIFPGALFCILIKRVEVEDYFYIPESVNRASKQKSRIEEVKWGIGYRGMCRFRSGTAFMQPVMSNFQALIIFIRTNGS